MDDEEIKKIEEEIIEETPVTVEEEKVEEEILQTAENTEETPSAEIIPEETTEQKEETTEPEKVPEENKIEENTERQINNSSEKKSSEDEEKEISQKTVPEDSVKQDLAWRKREDGSFVKEGIVEITTIEDLDLEIADLEERVRQNEKNLIPMPTGVSELVLMAVNKWNGDYVATDIVPLQCELENKQRLLTELQTL